MACVALAVTCYLVGTLVWHLEDADEMPPSSRFSMAAP